MNYKQHEEDMDRWISHSGALEKRRPTPQKIIPGSTTVGEGLCMAFKWKSPTSGALFLGAQRGEDIQMNDAA
jgi:hypothetical protein